MNGSTIFPVLSDAMLESYRNSASEADRTLYSEWLDVAEVYYSDRDKKDAAHCVSATLFWKHAMETTQICRNRHVR